MRVREALSPAPGLWGRSRLSRTRQLFSSSLSCASASGSGPLREPLQDSGQRTSACPSLGAAPVSTEMTHSLPRLAPGTAWGLLPGLSQGMGTPGFHTDTSLTKGTGSPAPSPSDSATGSTCQVGLDNGRTRGAEGGGVAGLQSWLAGEL